MRRSFSLPTNRLQSRIKSVFLSSRKEMQALKSVQVCLIKTENQICCKTHSSNDYEQSVNYGIKRIVNILAQIKKDKTY